MGGSSARDFDLEHNLTGEAIVSTEQSPLLVIWSVVKALIDLN